MRRSCSDSLLTASQLDKVFGSDRTTPNQVALELPSMRLRKFSPDGNDIATLVCAPLALHDAALTDFAPDHSLVAALQIAGLRNVSLSETHARIYWWCSPPKIGTANV